MTLLNLSGTTNNLKRDVMFDVNLNDGQKS